MSLVQTRTHPVSPAQSTPSQGGLYPSEVLPAVVSGPKPWSRTPEGQGRVTPLGSSVLPRPL